MDTPGVHKPASQLDRRMLQEIHEALDSRDVVLVLVDATRRGNWRRRRLRGWRLWMSAGIVLSQVPEGGPGAPGSEETSGSHAEETETGLNVDLSLVPKSEGPGAPGTEVDPESSAAAPEKEKARATPGRAKMISLFADSRS